MSSPAALASDVFKDMLFSEDFAVLLGLKKSALGNDIAKGDEIFRFRMMTAYMERNLKEHEDRQEIVWSRFSAFYLPATVDRFLDPWLPTDVTDDQKADFRLQNPCLEMLVAVQHNAYFSKYLRSTKSVAAGNVKLIRALAERLLALAPRWNRAIVSRGSEMEQFREQYVGAAANTIQLMSSILATYARYPDQEALIPAATRNSLRPYLLSWEKHHRGSFLGDVCERTVLQLFVTPEQDPEFHAHVKSVKRRMKGWDACGYPLCVNLEPKDMKTCSKCQTVRYYTSNCIGR